MNDETPAALMAVPLNPETVAGFSLYPWEHRQPFLRLVRPWQQAGLALARGSHWDQARLDALSGAAAVVLHRDFPRLAGVYQHILAQARQAGTPVVFDLDDLLLDLPEQHPSRRHHYSSDALFPVLRAIVEADAVTVSTPALQKRLQGLNPAIWLLPTFLDDSLWELRPPAPAVDRPTLVIGYIRDHLADSQPEGFTAAIERYLRQNGDRLLLRVWGSRPPQAWLRLANVDWLPRLPLRYADYAAGFAQPACDLFLVPHGDSPYERCQSPLRFLEHSASGVPAICSRIEPYSDLLVHGENGLLASSPDDWQACLDELLASARLRRRLAENARQTVRQDWLLSDHAHLWREAHERLQKAVPSQEEGRTLADQAARLSEQVQAWQRSLETRLFERDWEVRAQNLSLKRLERQASQAIRDIQAQRDIILNSRSWKLVQKIQRLRGVQLPGGLGPADSPAGGPPPEPASQAQAAPERARFAGHLQGWLDLSSDGLANLEDLLPRQSTYSLFFFTDQDWDTTSPENQALARRFARQGSLVFFASPDSSAPPSVLVQERQAGIFSLRLPLPGSQDQLDALLPTFQALREAAHLEQAVCLVGQPLWAPLAFSLRNLFGWKAVRCSAALPDAGAPLSQLPERFDLACSMPVSDQQFARLEDGLRDLYPKASIIILTYNNLDYNRQCLESIFAGTAYPNFDIIVVDNASSDGTPAFLRSFAASHPNLQVILNPENAGFAAGNNQGVAASDGEYVVFLNNDTVVTPGWLSGLIRYLRDPAVGFVGPVTNFSGNESRISVDYADIRDLNDFARRYTGSHRGQSFDIRMLALYCAVTRRSVLEEIGPLDERFNVGMYEDDDYSLRLRHAGYQILCAEDVYIHHWGSAGFSQFAQERYIRLQSENRRKFEEKWGTRWLPHRWRMDEP